VRATLVFYHSGDAWIRGSEIMLLQILERLDRERYRIVLVCDQEVLAGKASEIGDVSTHVIPIPEVMWDDGGARFPLVGWVGAVRRLGSILRAEKASLLYCNSALPAQTGVFAARRRGIPVVCHIHAPYTRRYAWMYRFHRADMVIFVSRFVLGMLDGRLRFKGPPQVVLNGVDTHRFRPPTARDPSVRERLGIPAGALVVGQVGSLIRRKGPDIAIRALGEPELRERNVSLVFVGDGPDRREFEKLSTDLGLANRVTFAGHTEDPLPFFQHAFDVVLLASRSEAMGLALLEGQACGIPAIAADSEGAPEAMIEGASGLLFPSEDHAALARSIASLAADPALRLRMGRSAREVALERFAVEGQMERIDRVISNLLDRPS
jgi:glycosyltransferase involved in cell wall biosynthesis